MLIITIQLHCCGQMDLHHTVARILIIFSVDITVLNMYIETLRTFVAAYCVLSDGSIQ